MPQAAGRGRWWGYWIATGLFCLAILPGGVLDLVMHERAMAVLTHLGYPPVLGAILGVWKILGAIALLVPGWPRLKEWAYAGFTFDLTGAATSHLWIGDPIVNVLGPLAFLGVLAASYVLRPSSRRLQGAGSEAQK